MDWKEYAKELLIFQVKVFSLPIEDVSKEKMEEFKSEFNELKKMGKLDWDAEAFAEDYYDAHLQSTSCREAKHKLPRSKAQAATVRGREEDERPAHTSRSRLDTNPEARPDDVTKKF